MKRYFTFSLLKLILFTLLYSTESTAEIWHETSGLGGGARSIVHTNLNSFAVSDNLIFRSSDDGISWHRLPNYYTQNLNDLEICSNNILRADDYGIFRSTDEGDSWTKVTTQTMPFFKIAVDGTNAFAISSNWLYRSTDSGLNWTQINLLNLGWLNNVVVKGNLVLVSDGLKTYISTDTGVTFSINSTPIFPILISGNRVFAKNNSGYVFTTDTAATWNPISGIPNNAGFYDISMEGTQLFLATSIGVYLSNDNGDTWAQIYDRSSRTIDSNNGTVLLGTDFMMRSVNAGTTWNYSAAGLNTSYVGDIIYDGSGLYAAGKGVFYTSDQGNTWEQLGGSITDPSANQLAKLGNYLFATTYDGVYRSADNGQTWTICNNGLSNLSTENILVYDSLLFVSVLTNMFPYLYVSSDSGATWTGDTISGAGRITSFMRKGNDIYFTTSWTGIFKSSDAGQTWNTLPSWPIALPILIKSHQNLLVTAGQNDTQEPFGIYYSQNDGITWDSMATPWSDSSSAIYDMISVGNYIIVSAFHDKGIYITNDLGVTWRNVTADLAPYSYIGGITLCYDGNFIYVGIQYGGIWRSSISALTTIDVDENTMSNFIVYPNPSEKELIIKSDLIKGENDVQVFDITGKEVLYFPNCNFNQDSKEIKINISTLVPGIYFFRVKNENSSISGKIIKS